jgi:sugar lactone lactonase YvrE
VNHTTPTNTTAPSRRSGGGGGLVDGRGIGARFCGVGETAALRLACLIALTLTALMALGVGSAIAGEIHLFTPPPIGEGGPGPGQVSLAAPAGVAVNDTSGDLYVTDAGNARVDQFEADGTFVRSFGSFSAPAFVAVDNSAGGEGSVYVADTTTDAVSKFGADGTLVSAWGTGGQLTGNGSETFAELGGVDGVGVNSSGNLFVLAGGTHMSVFGAGGAFIETFALQFPAGPLGFTIDNSAGPSAGDIYARYFAGTETLKFNPSGGFLSEVDFGAGTGIAVDPTDGDLYVATGTEVIRYDDDGVRLESFGSTVITQSAGLAVGAAGTVYVADTAAQQIERFIPAAVPDATTGSATILGLGEATLSGTVNPAGVAVEECVFEWGETEAPYEHIAPCETQGGGPIGSGSVGVAVHADLGGLATGTTYHFRLVAKNENGTTRGADRAFAILPPTVTVTSASEVTATSARLETEVNPQGLATFYSFQYGLTTAYESETPMPPAPLGAGTADVTRSAFISGLQPGTTYHYRVLATNPLGTVDGPDRTFTTQPAAGSSLLPDDRGWELVSPPLKQGIPLQPISKEGGVIQAAADGSAITYFADGAIVPEPPGNRSAVNTSQDLSVRESGGGWTTADISTPHQQPAGFAPGDGSEYKLFSSDLSSGGVEPFGATRLSPQAGEKTPYLRLADGSYEPLVDPSNVPPGTHFGGIETAPEEFQEGVDFVTASPDLAHVLVRSPTSLVSGFETGGLPNIYEWSGGALTPVSYEPSGQATLCGGFEPACVPAGGVVGFADRQMRNAISDDGSRVVFENGGGRLFLRDVPRGETIQLDAAETGCARCGSGGARFQEASADGSRVFFTDGEKLTSDSTASAGKPDLYMCQAAVEAGHLTCALTDLTANAHDPADSAAVQGLVIGVAADGSSVYFVADGALTEGEGAVRGDCAGAEPAPTDSCNLYRYDIATASLRLVAILSGADFNDWSANEANSPFRLTARVSPNGRFLAFMSQRPLTGYDNRDARSGVRDQEVFVYDSTTGRLTCASCNPSGARPQGVFDPGVFPGLLVDGPLLWGGQTLAASIPGWTTDGLQESLYQSRYLSNSGRLFFNAADALVPQDTNGTEDVYQYEPPGVGSCTEAGRSFVSRDGGCVDLISSGTSGEESAFMDASESGDDVFFLTASRLTAKDEDSVLDLYDARVGGGEAAPVKPVECSGDACQQPAVPPNDATPNSLTFNGAGNQLNCPKGKVKQKGKCAKKKQKKAKKHKKSAKQKKKKKSEDKKQKRANGQKKGGRK